MNKDQISGRIKKAKGAAKKIAGKVAGDKDLEREGRIQTSVGIVQAGLGDLKEEVKKTVDTQY